MQFSSILGQQNAKKQLLQMWQSNHFPHALLINGKEGFGGLPIALALSQYILCSNKNELDSCGICANCQKVSKFEHADLHFSFPTINASDSKKALSDNYLKSFREFIASNPYGTTFQWLQHIEAGNKQGNITAEECRVIIEKISLKSYEGKEKILILWRPEFLGKEGNILLKLIEEPPPFTHFIFVSQQIDEILPTILSRTQQLLLRPVEQSSIESYLIQSNIAKNQASQIAFLSEGSVSKAIELTEHIENDLFPNLRQWFNMIFTNNGIGIAKFVDDIAKEGRENQRNFLTYVIKLLEACIRIKYTGTAKLATDELNFANKLATIPSLTIENLQSIIEELSITSYHVQRNANSKLQFMTLSLKILYVIQNKKVSSLIK
jgi:DNA polymerase-3 subunit delta'